MRTIAHSNVIIGENRQRKHFDEAALTLLMQDIDKNGLIHPIVLREDGKPQLVAGERRYRAMEKLLDVGLAIKHNGETLPPGFIPYTVMGELDELAYEEAELSENVARMDLTWQERAEAVAKLDALRRKQAEARGEEWTLTDTAEEVYGTRKSGGNNISAQTAIIVNEYLDDPEVAKAKSLKDAAKVVTRKKEELRRAELAKNFDASVTTHELIRGNCLDIIPTLPDNSFDIILSDPPYGIEMHKDQSWDGTHHEYDDSFETWTEIFNTLPGEYFRVAKPEAHLYLFCDILQFPRLAELVSAAGWEVWPRPFIWYKGNTGSYPKPEHGPRYTYEALLFANKGNRRTTKLYHDVLPIPQPINQLHPAGKPVDLYADLLRRSALPGDTVLDTFCGSGTIFPAATKLQCTATGIELNPKYADMAAERMMEDTNED